MSPPKAPGESAEALPWGRKSLGSSRTREGQGAEAAWACSPRPVLSWRPEDSSDFPRSAGPSGLQHCGGRPGTWATSYPSTPPWAFPWRHFQARPTATPPRGIFGTFLSSNFPAPSPARPCPAPDLALCRLSPANTQTGGWSRSDPPHPQIGAPFLICLPSLPPS